MTFFSIIVPTYNRAGIISETIDSILNQEYSAYEVIIVDDGSTDNTAEVIQAKYGLNSKVTYYKKNNEERGAARNFGAKKAKGDFVNFFDSDDIMNSNHLQVANKFIQDHPGTVVFHLGYSFKTPETGAQREVALSGDVNARLISGNLLSCNSVFVKREVLLENMFNEDRRIAVFEDWELWLRLAARYPVEYDNTVTSVIIDHDSRSVYKVDKDKLILRATLFMKYLSEDEKFYKAYRNKLYLLKSSVYSYVALHLALSKGHRGLVVKYLLQGILTNPASLFTRRFLATVKHFI